MKNEVNRAFMAKKKVLVLAAAMMVAVTSAKAEVEFAYEAGADLVSAYIWRGQYNGGLSFQPEGLVGFDALDGALEFRAGAWANIGASDWKFKTDGTDLPYDCNTYFVPELDFIASVSAYGASVGYNAYFYCDDGSTHQSEIWAGYNFSHLFGDKAGAYINWYTMIGGGGDRLLAPTMTDPLHEKQAFSTYIELGYDYTFDDWGLTLGGQLGISPWQSVAYGNDGFAVVNLSLKANKEWEFDKFTLDLYALGSLNPNGMITDKNDIDYNVYVNRAGDDKIGVQKLNGCIGLGIWF